MFWNDQASSRRQAEWAPLFNQQALQSYISQYNLNPGRYSEKELESIKKHAEHYRVPFAESDKFRDQSVRKILRQVGEGYISGFTTLNIGDDPNTKWERIARNVGRLGGFVGYMPSAPLKAMGLKQLSKAATHVAGKSIPMVAAGFITKKASALASQTFGTAILKKGLASASALSFLKKAEIGTDIIKGAFHMGAASGVASWQGGIDQVMSSFIHGAGSGAVFRGIGNFLGKGSDLGSKAARSLATSAYMGIPSTLRKATTEEQVYEYLMGAYFGFKEMPASKRKAGEFLVEMRKGKKTVPEEMKGWEFLSPDAQKIVKDKSIVLHTKDPALQYKILSELMGVDVEKIPQAAEAYLEAQRKSLSAEGTVALVNKAIGKSSSSLDYDFDIPNIQTLTQKTKDFTLKNFKNKYVNNEKPELTHKNALMLATEIQQKWNSLSEFNYIDGVNSAERMMDWLKSEDGMGMKKISSDDVSMWRQIGIRKATEKPVHFIQGRASGDIRKLKHGTSTTDGGKSKNIVEARKHIEDIYELAFYEHNKTEVPNSPTYIIMDTISDKVNQVEIDGQLRGGKWSDFSMSRYKGQLARKIAKANKGMGEQDVLNRADVQFNHTIAKYMKEMDSSGYGFFGGRGASGRHYYIKYHPAIASSKGVSLSIEFNKLIQGISKPWQVLSKTRKNILKDMNNFVKDFSTEKDGLTPKEATQLYKKLTISNAMYDAQMNGFHQSEYSKMFETGNWIKHAKHFNKRAQIWFTSGFAPEVQYFNKDGKIKDMSISESGEESLRYILEFEADAIEAYKKIKGPKKASQLTESTDGAIRVRNDIMDSINAMLAMAPEGAKNKSFILSPHSKLGALLGKYQFEAAGPLESEAMIKSGIHLMIPSSAAKQFGTRKMHFTDFSKKGITVSNTHKGVYKALNKISGFGQDVIYDLPLSGIRGIFSEKIDSGQHYKTKFPKPMYAVLSPYLYSSEGDPKSIARNSVVIEDIYNSLSRNAFKGQAKYNKMASDYASNPNPKMEAELIKNIDNIGIAQILKIVHQRNTAGFTSKAILHMTKTVDESLGDAVNDGELTKADYELMTAHSQMDNDSMKKQLQLDKGTMGAITHKNTLPYVNTVLNKYVVQRLTRPKPGNGFKLRMASYSKELQRNTDKYGNTSLLENRDDIFFFDKGDRSREVVFGGKKWKLGDLWNAHVDGKFNTKTSVDVREFFRAIAVRVPCDNPSGAQVLEFAGFTSRRGYGVLLHPRTMQLLGGADLDGDTAFVFFGGRSETGDGALQPGMKKSWKDLYAGQKYEFFSEGSNGGSVMLTGATKGHGFKALNKATMTNLLNINRDTPIHVGDEPSGADRAFQDVLKKNGFKNVTVHYGQKKGARYNAGFETQFTEGGYRAKDKTMIGLAERILGSNELGKSSSKYVKLKPFFNATTQSSRELSDSKKAIDPESGKAYDQWLAKQGPVKEAIEAPELRFSPYQRFKALSVAAEGLDLLGVVINSRAILHSAYASIMQMKDHTTRGNTVYLEGEKMKLFVTAKNDKVGRKRFRELIRAAASLAADATEEAGLRTFDEIYRKIFGSIFDVKLIDKTGFVIKATDKFNLIQELPIHILKSGIFKSIGDIARAAYSKNYEEGRQFSGIERQMLFGGGNGIAHNQRNTFLTKLGGDLAEHDWSITPLSMINKKYTMDKHARFESIIKNYEFVRKIMKRRSVSVPFTATVMRKALSDNISNPDVYQSIIYSTKKGQPYHDWFNQLDGGKSKKISMDANSFSKLVYSEDDPDAIDLKLSRRNKETIQWRKKKLGEVYKLANDILSSNLTDMTTLEVSAEYIEQALALGIAKKDIHSLLKHSDNLKRASSLNKAAGREERRRTEKIGDVVDEFSDIGYGYGKGIKESALSTEEIDSAVLHIKDKIRAKYTKGQAEVMTSLLDTFILGSYHAGYGMSTKELKTELGKLNKKTNKAEIEELKHRYKMGVNTSDTQLGWSLTNISPDVLQKFQDRYNKHFLETRGDFKSEMSDESKFIKEKLNEIPRLLDKNLEPRPDDVKLYYDFDTETRKFLDEVAPFEGIHKGTLGKQARGIYSELAGHVKFYRGHGLGENLNYFARSVTGKDLNSMTYSDFNVLNRTLSMYREGTVFSRLFRPTSKTKEGLVVQKVNSWVWHLFPRQVSRDLLRTGMNLVEREGPYMSAEHGMVLGKTKSATHTMGQLSNLTHYMHEQGILHHQRESDELNKKLSPYITAVDGGRELHNIAWVQKESSNVMRVFLVNKHYTDPVRASEEFNIYLSRRMEAEKNFNWSKNKHKTHNIQEVVDGKVVHLKLSNQEIVERIKNIYTVQSQRVLDWQKGNTEAFDKYIKKDKHNSKYFWDRERNYPIIDVDLFIKDIGHHYRRGTQFPIDMGIDNLRLVSKSFMLSDITKHLHRKNITAEQSKALKKHFGRILRAPILKTGELPSEIYMPHLEMDKKISLEHVKFIVNQIENDKSMTKEEAKHKIARVLTHHNSVINNLPALDELQESMGFDIIDDILGPNIKNKAKFKDKIKWFESNQRVGSQHEREFSLNGWNTDPEVYGDYMNNVIKLYHKQLSQIVGRFVINDFNSGHLTKGWDPKQKKAWTNVYKLYMQQALGNAAVIPESIREMPEMKLKKSLYGATTDDAVAKTMTKLAKNLGFKVGGKNSAEKLLGMTDLTPEQMMHWSNIEAKYQVATLLAHPKASINNLFGGELHTGINVGIENLKNARNLEYLKNNINKEWKGWDDVNKSVRELGVIEEFMLNELSINPRFKNKEWRKAGIEIIDILSKNPGAEKKTLNNILKKHKISEKVFSGAVWFMQSPERTLRRDAFLSSMLQAYDNIGGTIKDPFNNPYLIEMGKKGVKASQFLYSAPFRPMFGATALGKVVTRFQMWAWNSVRFRNDIIDEAHRLGWDEGTPEFERYQRMITADMMVLALGNVFMYSLFETALPAPLGWAQDLADLVFGDEETRDRAFFGAYPGAAAPLQMFTPPSMRMVGPTMNAILNDDWSKMSSYYVWTMAPFGRIARDVLGESGYLREGPARFIEKSSGVPFHGSIREAKKLRDGKYRRGPMGTRYYGD